MRIKALGRLTASEGQPTMKAVVTMGNGGYDQLIYCDVARPTPGQSEVLVQVPCKIVSDHKLQSKSLHHCSQVSS